MSEAPVTTAVLEEKVVQIHPVRCWEKRPGKGREQGEWKLVIAVP